MNLSEAIKVQFLFMIQKRNFKFIFSFIFLLSLYSYILSIKNSLNLDVFQMYSSHFLYIGNSNSNIWSVFSVLFPFVVVFPFAFSYVEDKGLKNDAYIMRRFGKKHYFLSKYINSFLGGALIIFIPFLINLILCYITFPLNNNTSYGSIYFIEILGDSVTRKTVQAGKPFLRIYLFNPILYNIFYLVLLSIFSGIMSVFSLSCSFYIKRLKILLFIPGFFIFYLSPILDSMIYNNEQLTYFSVDLLNYVTIDGFYGLSVPFILSFISLIAIFSFCSYRYICAKEEI